MTTNRSVDYRTFLRLLIMNAFTVLLTAFGLGLATCQDMPMTCDETLLAEFPKCATRVNPNVETLANGITFAKTECNKCVKDLEAKRSELETPLCNGTDLTTLETKFDTAVMNAKTTCSANKAHCSAAEDFLAGNKSTLARAQKTENTNMACTCVVKPGMYPKATCNQRKMLFNCATPKVKEAKDAEAKMPMPSVDETCLQMFARNRTDFCNSDCVKIMQDAGGRFDEKADFPGAKGCLKKSSDYKEFDLDFENTCKECEDMKCLVFRSASENESENESEKSSANSAQVGLVSAVVVMMVSMFSAYSSF
eukprot:459932_1